MDGGLANAADCVAADRPGLLRRLRQAPFRLASNSIVDLATTIGVPRLSEVAEERLALPPAPVLGEAEALIRPDAVGAVRAAVQAQQDLIGPAELQRQLAAVGSLSEYQVRRAGTLRTALFIRGRASAVPESEVAAPYFVDGPGRIVWLAASLPCGISDEDALAAAITQLVGASVQLPLAAILRGSGEALGAVCALLDVPDAEALRLERRGVPGEPLIEEDAPILQMRPTRIFYPNEVVAIASPAGDGALVYGQILPEPGGAPFQPGEARAISIGTETLRTLPSGIWCFRSAIRQGVAPTAAPPAPGRPARSGGAPARVAAPVAGGALSRAEYARALRDLAQHSGADLGEDEAQLLAARQQLRGELDAAQDALRRAEARCGELETDAERRGRSDACPVCLSGVDDGVELEVALVPCGHLFCSGCAARLHECATCKRRVTSRLRVYR